MTVRKVKPPRLPTIPGEDAKPTKLDVVTNRYLHDSYDETQSRLTTIEGELLPAGGSTGQVLTKIDATDYNVDWETPSGGSSSPLTTKGDVYTFDTADARLAVGADGNVLTADSSNATGLKWAAAAGGSSGGFYMARRFGR